MTALDESEILRLAPQLLRDDSFTVVSASLNDHLLYAHFHITGRPELYGARIPLPSAELPMPFLYTEPRDEADFLSMLRIWIGEEAATGCAEWGELTLIDGVNYFSLTRDGFRHAPAI